MKNWKPKINEVVWYPNIDFNVRKMIFDETNAMHVNGAKRNLLFRTKSLAQAALRDVKKVLKKARKA